MFQARPLLSTFVTLSLLATASITSAQQQSPGAALTVTSRLTLVDVTATDSKGTSVHGLTKPDFTVKEDRKPQSIRDFEEHAPEKLAAQDDDLHLPPHVFTNLQLAPPTGASNVLLFDDVATGLQNRLKASPENLMYARQQALKYLNTMPPGTRIAILELADSLRVVQAFTSDRALLLAAVNSLSSKTVHGVNYAQSSRPGSLEEGCSLFNKQSDLTVNALDGVAAYLAGVPGRKNLIWFTPGTPWLTDYSAFSRIPCLRDYTDELQRDYALLTAARVALYPVDPRGLVVCQHCGALQEDLSSLQEMAEATGGAAYFNRNDLDTAVSQAIATGADFYSLSYIPPPSKYDGRFHKIDVKVDRPGIHLQYRNGYTAIDLSKPPQSGEKRSDKSGAQSKNELRIFMAHGAAPSTQLIFGVRMTPSTEPAKPGDPTVTGHPIPALKNKPLVRYDFQYALDPAQIALENAVDGKRKGAIKLVMAVYDGDGKVLNAMSAKIDLAVKSDQLAQFLQKPLKFPEIPVQFDLPPGKIFVRVGVRDVTSDKVGTLEIPVSVDKPKQ